MATLNPVSGAVHLYKRWDRAVRGWPEQVLTFALVAIALFCLWVAFSDRAGLKGLVVAWMVLP